MSLSNRVSIIIRRYRSYEVFCLYGCFVYDTLSYSFGSNLCHCIYGFMFCMLLFDFINYVFLLLRVRVVMFMYSYCYVSSVLGILLHCVILCIVCV